MGTTREQTLNTLNYKESNITNRIYALRLQCKMRYPNSIIFIILLTIHHLLMNLTYTFRTDYSLLWGEDKNAFYSISKFLEIYNIDFVIKRSTTGIFQIVFLLILGFLQLMGLLTIMLSLVIKKKSLFFDITKKIFSSSFFAWFCYLLISPQLFLFASGLKCSGFLSFLVGVDNTSGTILQQDFGNRNGMNNNLDEFWSGFFALFSFIFIICTLFNYYIFTTMSVTRRIKNNKFGFRKNTNPETLSLVCYFLSSIFYVYNNNFAVSLLTTIICFFLIVITTFSKSSYGNSKTAFLCSIPYSASLWFSIFGLLQLIYPNVIQAPLLTAFLTYICLLIVIILLRKDDSYLNKLYNPIVRFKDDEEMVVLNMLENLNLMFIESKNSSKMMIYMCGYITRFQEVNDHNVESVISFRRLLNYKDYLPPKRYRENMEEGFVKHISERYIEAIYRYPKSAEIRLSFSYFLNDYMQMRNSAMEMMKSAEYFARKSYLLGYQHFHAKSILQDFDMKSSKDENKENSSGGEGGGSAYVSENDETQNLAISKNIFLTSAKEEAMMRKNITELRKKELKNVVKQAIVVYSDLWRELQGDSPDSIKVTDSLFNVDYEIQKTEDFWKTFQDYFKENPQALYYFGVYCLVIKYNTVEGHGYINRAKEIMKKSIRLKFKPKAIKYGLDLSECQNPISYLSNKHVKINFFLIFF